MFRQFIKALEQFEPVRFSWARSSIGSAGASSSGKGGSSSSTHQATPESNAKKDTPVSARQETSVSEKHETVAISSVQQEPLGSEKQETPTMEKKATSSAFERNSVTKEQKLTQILKDSIPGITYVSIQDISGGCGAMFEINVEAKEFNGLTRLKQHRLVTDSLKSEIPEMHGIRINTTAPPPAPPTLSK